MKNLSYVLNTFENIMEKGAFALLEQMLHFHYIFKYMIFQGRQKGLLWSRVMFTSQCRLLITFVNSLDPDQDPQNCWS